MAIDSTERLPRGFRYGQRIPVQSRYYLQTADGRLAHFLELGAAALAPQQYQVWDRSIGAVVCYGR